MKIKNSKGFTLIELLIVVAIIAILAAIAIPQFAAYRMRGYNAAADSDVRNGGTAEEAMMADFQGYGWTITPQTLPGTGLVGQPGYEQAGPITAASGAVMGGLISTGPANGGLKPVCGVGVSVSNNVTLRADTSNYPVGPLVGYGQTYIIATKHTQGDRAFAREAESTSLFVCQNSTSAWVNVAGIALPGVIIPVPTPGVDLSSPTGAPTVGCGGVEIKNWTPQ